MLGVHLAIDEFEVEGLQTPDQGDEGHLGGVARPGEHGFAEEAAPQGDAVQAAHEAAILPAFH